MTVQTLQPASGGSTQPPPLTFSTSLFRQISPSLYLQRHLLHDPPKRPNGRLPSQCRDFSLTTNSLTHAHGSAVVRVGDTAVVCGVRGEILTLAPGDDPSRFESYLLPSTSAIHACGSHGSGGASWGGLVVPNVELSTGCSKKYPLGPPGILAQTLSDQLQDLISVSKLVDLKSLRIYSADGIQSPSTRIKGYWSLYVDVLCISLDGNLLDAAWYAIVAALTSTKLPLALWNQTEETIFCDPASAHPLSIRRSLPFTTTFALVAMTDSPGNVVPGNEITEIGGVVLNDPDSYEEEEASETITIFSTTDFKPVQGDQPQFETRIEKIIKIGGLNIGIEQLENCARLSSSKAAQYTQLLLKERLPPPP